MSDRLKQVGKTLKQGKKDAGYALNRYSENFPKIERARDVIAAEVPGESLGDPPTSIARDFDMHFKTKRPDNRVTLDLVFLLPWCGCITPPDET